MEQEKEEIMGKQEIRAKRVPTPSRLFSRGVFITNPKKMIFLSGTCSYQGGEIKEQTLDVYRNIDALLKEAGATWGHVVRVLFFLRDIERDFEKFDEGRREFFQEAGIKPPYPASTGVQARLVSDDFLLEMEVTAVID
jgi:2-iminobutanoate/2-iminopropanoate deaminase